MGFSIRKATGRHWPVTFALLAGDAEGNVSEVEHGFVLSFVSFTEDEFDAIIAAEERALFGDLIPDLSLRTPKQTLELNARIFPRLVNGWSKLLDESGVPVPYSAASLVALIKGPDGMAISSGINRALAQIRFGVAPAKNASASLAPGREPAAAEAAPTN